MVVKYGGHAMSDERAAECFAQDIVLMQKLGVRPVVVHGGGPQIGDMLKRLNTTSQFIDGLRVTDAATVKVSEMVLCGSINKQISAAISRLGGRALGLSGKDDSLIVADKLVKERLNEKGNVVEIVDLGFVGEPAEVNAKLLNDVLDDGRIPVVAPIAAVLVIVIGFAVKLTVDARGRDTQLSVMTLRVVLNHITVLGTIRLWDIPQWPEQLDATASSCVQKYSWWWCRSSITDIP